MLRFFKSFFSKAKPPETTETTAPYKIEPPVPLTPPVVDMSVFPHLTVDGHGDVQEVKKPEPKPKKAPAKKPVAKKQAAPKAPAPKKPRPKKSKPA